MALFGNKKEGNAQGSGSGEDLPKLPKLPDQEGEDNSQEKLPKLPKYPSTEMGDKMSQSSIKEAVSGEKEDEESADEFVHEQMTPEPDHLEEREDLEYEEDEKEPRRMSPNTTTKRPRQKKVAPEPPQRKQPAAYRKKTEKNEPVFVRIDKFEDSRETFDNAKDKISEMEKLLSDIKETKEKEEKELANWEKEVKELKGQVDKIEDDVFSRV